MTEQLSRVKALGHQYAYRARALYWALNWTIMLLVAMVAAALASEPNYPELTGPVVDEAKVLSASSRSRLNEMLAQHTQQTGNEVVVLTIKSLQGHSIFEFGFDLSRHWGMYKEKKNGVLLIVAPNERKVRIEVGIALWGKLTNSIRRRIIERDILPAFERGDLNAGTLAGTTSIIRVLSGVAPLANVENEYGEWGAASHTADLTGDIELSRDSIVLSKDNVKLVLQYVETVRMVSGNIPFLGQQGDAKVFEIIDPPKAETLRCRSGYAHYLAYAIFLPEGARDINGPTLSTAVVAGLSRPNLNDRSEMNTALCAEYGYVRKPEGSW